MGPKIQLISKEDACKIVANEFSNDWIKQNIYRVTETTKASHMLDPMMNLVIERPWKKF